MAVQLTQVGQPYPQPLPPGEGLLPTLQTDGSLVVVAKMGRLQKGDVRAFRRTVEVAATPLDDVALVVLTTEAYQLDGYVNPHAYRAEDLSGYLDGERANATSLVLVEGPDDVVRHIRLVGVQTGLVEALREAVRASARRYRTVADVNAAFAAVQARYATGDIAAKARSEGTAHVFRR